MKELKCPICKRPVTVSTDKKTLVDHGPGKKTFICEGSGKKGERK